MIKKIPNIEVLHIIEESIQEGNSVRLRVRGNSMSPTLLDGIDVVTLKPFDPEDLKVGDVILFRYGVGFLLHRIIEIQKSNHSAAKIVTRGDALEKHEEIMISDVVALAELPVVGPIKRIIRRFLKITDFPATVRTPEVRNLFAKGRKERRRT